MAFEHFGTPCTPGAHFSSLFRQSALKRVSWVYVVLRREVWLAGISNAIEQDWTIRRIFSYATEVDKRKLILAINGTSLVEYLSCWPFKSVCLWRPSIDSRAPMCVHVCESECVCVYMCVCVYTGRELRSAYGVSSQPGTLDDTPILEMLSTIFHWYFSTSKLRESESIKILMQIDALLFLFFLFNG